MRFVYCFEIPERLKALSWPRIHKFSVETWFVNLTWGLASLGIYWIDFGILLRLTSVILFYFYLIHTYFRSKHLIGIHFYWLDQHKPLPRLWTLDGDHAQCNFQSVEVKSG